MGRVGRTGSPYSTATRMDTTAQEKRDLSATAGPRDRLGPLRAGWSGAAGRSDRASLGLHCCATIESGAMQRSCARDDSEVTVGPVMHHDGQGLRFTAAEVGVTVTSDDA